MKAMIGQLHFLKNRENSACQKIKIHKLAQKIPLGKTPVLLRRQKPISREVDCLLSAPRHEISVTSYRHAMYQGFHIIALSCNVPLYIELFT